MGVAQAPFGAHDSGIRLAPALFVILVLGVTVAAVAAWSGASGQTGPALSFAVGPPGGCIEVGVGDEFEIALAITDVEDLQAWEATISHDFDVIRILEHDVRIFLAQGGGLLFEASEPLPDNDGRHLLAVGATKAVTGSGILATIKFEAVGAGVSTIDIPQNDFDGDGDTDEGALLTGSGGLIGDVNGDNFFDGPVQSALIAVNASCGSPTDQPTGPPTPNPVTSSPSSSAAATPGASNTSAPTQSAGTTTSTAPPSTSVATATATSVQGNAVWGDNNCSGEANPIDSLFTLRFDAGLVVETGACPAMGAAIEILSASPHIWGDIDCGGEVTPVDSLKLLRFDAGLSVAQEQGCPGMGTSITIVEG